MIEQLLSDIYKKKSHYCIDFSPNDQEEIIKSLKAKLPGVRMISSYREWRNSRITNTDMVIVGNTYKIIEDAKNGRLFEKALKSGTVFLFFLNDKINERTIREEWDEFLTKANLYIFQKKLIFPYPKQGLIPKINSLVVSGLSLLLLIGVVVYLGNKFNTPKIISLLVSGLSLLLLIGVLVYSGWKSLKTNSGIFPLIFIILGIIDIIFGISYIEISIKIYKFIYSLIKYVE